MREGLGELSGGLYWSVSSGLDSVLLPMQSAMPNEFLKVNFHP